jgi:hypothetical protein
MKAQKLLEASSRTIIKQIIHDLEVSLQPSAQPKEDDKLFGNAAPSLSGITTSMTTGMQSMFTWGRKNEPEKK